MRGDNLARLSWLSSKPTLLQEESFLLPSLLLTAELPATVLNRPSVRIRAWINFELTLRRGLTRWTQLLLKVAERGFAAYA